MAHGKSGMTEPRDGVGYTIGKPRLSIDGVSEADAAKIAGQDAILAQYAETIHVRGIPSTINYCVGAAHARKMLRSTMHALMWKAAKDGAYPGTQNLRNIIQGWLQ